MGRYECSSKAICLAYELETSRHTSCDDAVFESEAFNRLNRNFFVFVVMSPQPIRLDTIILLLFFSFDLCEFNKLPE